VLDLGIQSAWPAGHAAVRLATLQPSQDLVVTKQLRSSYAMKKSILETKWHSSTRPCWIIYGGHLAGVSVAPEDYDASQFWSAPPVLKSKAISKLTQSGAKAIVARDIPAEFKTSDGNVYQIQITTC
jgi:hypothetical protein